MDEEFGKVVSEVTTVRTTKEINSLLENARLHILKTKNVKTTYARIIEVLVGRYLKEEGLLKNNDNE